MKPDAASASSESGVAEAPSSSAQCWGTRRGGKGSLGQLKSGRCCRTRKGEGIVLYRHYRGEPRPLPDTCRHWYPGAPIHRHRVFPAPSAQGLSVRALTRAGLENKMQHSTFFQSSVLSPVTADTPPCSLLPHELTDTCSFVSSNNPGVG